MISNKVSILKQENVRKRLLVDFLIFIALAFLGWVSIFSAEYVQDQNVGAELFALKKSYSRQLLWIICALIAGIIILNVQSSLLVSIAPLLYMAGLGIMIIIIFFGTYTRGSNSWISVGGIQFQFAELMVLITILFLSKYVSNLDFMIDKQKYRFMAMAIFVVPFLLTVAQRELGLGLVFLPLIFVLYREGLPVYFILIPLYFIVVGILSIAVSWQNFSIAMGVLLPLVFLIFRKFFWRNKMVALMVLLLFAFTIFLQVFLIPWSMKKLLHTYQINRIYSTFQMSTPVNHFTEADLINNFESPKHKNDDNYNVFQSIVAIGSGGFFGKGFLKNTQTRLNFVPERSTDFIFCSYAESFGFLGTIVLLGLFLLLIIRMLNYAENQRNIQLRAYTYGFVAVLTFHLVVNIGMTVGLFPVIGIPLPFISYGGSSFLTFSMMYFLLLRLQTGSPY